MPNINVDISRYYQPKHPLRWTWKTDRDMFTNVTTKTEVWGNSNYAGGQTTTEITNERVINSYIITVRYEGPVNIGDKTIMEITLPNYWTDYETRRLANKKTGISANGNYTDCGEKVFLCCLCVTCICCLCIPDCYTKFIKQRKTALNVAIDGIANERFEKEIAEIVKGADARVEQSIQLIQQQQSAQMASLPPSMGNMVVLTPEQLQLLLRNAQMGQPTINLGQNAPGASMQQSQPPAMLISSMAGGQLQSQTTNQVNAPMLFSNPAAMSQSPINVNKVASNTSPLAAPQTPNLQRSTSVGMSTLRKEGEPEMPVMLSIMPPSNVAMSPKRA